MVVTYIKTGYTNDLDVCHSKNQYLDFVRKNKKNNSVDYDEVENYVSEGMENKARK